MLAHRRRTPTKLAPPSMKDPTEPPERNRNRNNEVFGPAKIPPPPFGAVVSSSALSYVTVSQNVLHGDYIPRNPGNVCNWDTKEPILSRYDPGRRSRTLVAAARLRATINPTSSDSFPLRDAVTDFQRQPRGRHGTTVYLLLPRETITGNGERWNVPVSEIAYRNRECATRIS